MGVESTAFGLSSTVCSPAKRTRKISDRLFFCHFGTILRPAWSPIASSQVETRRILPPLSGRPKSTALNACTQAR